MSSRPLPLHFKEHFEPPGVLPPRLDSPGLQKAGRLRPSQPASVPGSLQPYEGGGEGGVGVGDTREKRRNQKVLDFKLVED